MCNYFTSFYLKMFKTNRKPHVKRLSIIWFGVQSNVVTHTLHSINKQTNEQRNKHLICIESLYYDFVAKLI